MGIEIKDLKVSYDDRVIIPNANLKIPSNKITMLIGPNGCGKSTMLKSIARIIPVQNGQILLHGKDMKKIPQRELAKQMAVLPQSPIVPEGILVKDLVAYGRFPYQKPLSGLKKEDHEIIQWAMEKTGVSDLKDRKVEELSGGQRQRVWISLALAQKTNVLILDEPTTYLDMAHQLEILELLKKLNEEEKQNIELTKYETEQEENAIISLDELLAKGKTLVEQNEVTQYQDDGNEPISISELEERYRNKEENVEVLDTEDEVKSEKPKVSIDDFLSANKETVQAYQNKSTYHPSPIISPIYGIEKEPINKNTTLELENTANYQKFDEEIRKTNEFLSKLKELQQKLD